MLTVLSTQGSPGASTTALHLAAHWASTGREVLLIEADPAGGSMSHSLGIQFTPGSASFVAAGLPVLSSHLIDHAQDVLFENLHVMPAPGSPTGARGILDTFAEHTHALRAISENEMAVIIDGGRITSESAVSRLTTDATGVVAVCRNNHKLPSLELLDGVLAAEPGDDRPRGFAVSVGESPMDPDEWYEFHRLTYCGAIELMADAATDLAAYLNRGKRKSKKWRASLERVGEELLPLAHPPMSGFRRTPPADPFAPAGEDPETSADQGDSAVPEPIPEPGALDPAGHPEPIALDPAGHPEPQMAPGPDPSSVPVQSHYLPPGPQAQPGTGQSHYLPPATPWGYPQAPPVAPPEHYGPDGRPVPYPYPPPQYPAHPYEQAPPYGYEQSYEQPAPGSHEAHPAGHPVHPYEQPTAPVPSQDPYYQQAPPPYEDHPAAPHHHHQPAPPHHDPAPAPHHQQPPPRPPASQAPPPLPPQDLQAHTPQPHPHAPHEPRAQPHPSHEPQPPAPQSHTSKSQELQAASPTQSTPAAGSPTTSEPTPADGTETAPVPTIAPTGSFRDWAAKLHGVDADDDTAIHGGG